MDAREAVAQITLHTGDGASFSFPFERCQTWTSMATTIRQTLRHDRASLHLFDKNSFNIIGPNEAIILPHVWEHIVRAGWDVRLELLRDREVEHQCIEMPQMCQGVDGAAGWKARGNTAKPFEEATKELQAIREARGVDIAEREADREARQKEREDREELDRLFVEFQNIREAEQKEHENAQRARREERNEQWEMQQARAAEREEQRIMQQTRKREREAQRGQREVSALVVDAANTAEVVGEQEVAPRARGCCSAALQRHSSEPSGTGCKTRHRCFSIQKRRARYLVWFAGGNSRHGYKCCQCCKC